MRKALLNSATSPSNSASFSRPQPPGRSLARPGLAFPATPTPADETAPLSSPDTVCFIFTRIHCSSTFTFFSPDFLVTIFALPYFYGSLENARPTAPVAGSIKGPGEPSAHPWKSISECVCPRGMAHRQLPRSMTECSENTKTDPLLADLGPLVSTTVSNLPRPHRMLLHRLLSLLP